MITAMLLLFAGANSLSAVCMTKETQPVRAKTAATNAPNSSTPCRNIQPGVSTKPINTDGQSEESSSDDDKADLGQPPSPVLERQFRTAPVHSIDHRGSAQTTRIAAAPQRAKPRLATPIRTNTIKPQACVAGFPRSTNGPPTQ